MDTEKGPPSLPPRRPEPLCITPPPHPRPLVLSRPLAQLSYFILPEAEVRRVVRNVVLAPART